jgi:formylglycine-generating enzyme required for sulfatase activity
VFFEAVSFCWGTAPPEHRYHQKAARADLKILLPETGSDIKGHMRSYAELLEASGYGSRPDDFDHLIRILDNEIRLITPTDPEGKDADSDSVLQTRPGQKYYQLTHDYLVHSIREWLTRKQKETRRGRAELMLADRAALWNTRPENRQLPSLWQWVTIRCWVPKTIWTPAQQTMMARAGKYHAVRVLALGLFTAAAAATCLAIHDQVAEQLQAAYAAGLVERLLDADTAQLPRVVDELVMYRRWTDPLLRVEITRSGDKSRRKLHASLALLPVDGSQVAYLSDRLLDAEPREVPILRDALAAHKDDLLEKLWLAALDPEKGKESERLRAAAALAQYDPENQRWARCGPQVGNMLLQENPVYLGAWIEAFRPVKKSLLMALAKVFRDRDAERASERTLATNLLADYAADQPQLLAELLTDADEKQFAVIYAKFQDQGEQGMPLLTAVIETKLPADLPSSDDKRETLAKRQANAAVALLRLNQPATVWPLLRHSPDPRVRSYLIHRLRPLGAEAMGIVKQLDMESDITIRRALVLSLGERDETEFPTDARNALLAKMQETYRTASDPGLHAACDWLLRRWKQEAWLAQANEEWARRKVAGGAWQLEGRGDLVPPPGTQERSPGWYVNGQGQTFVVIPGPVVFTMGSPPTQKDRAGNETQHRRRIGRTFAIAATTVTKEQFLRFRPKFAHGQMMRYPEPNCPMGGVMWDEAAAYCNWLSKQEAIPEDQWCYETKGNTVTLKERYLSRSGYRLPTEAELEFATRAGAVTSRFFGETEALLTHYAWYVNNTRDSTRPVGSLKPNDLGLFDVQGNVYVWCQDRYQENPAGKVDDVVEDRENGLPVTSTDTRVLRGGSFNVQASFLRSAFRFGFYVPNRLFNVGFRPARALLLGGLNASPPRQENSGKPGGDFP